jgi:hypothetical protein
MSDLVTWLRAQLDEDERVAREASGDAWVTGASQGYEYARPGDIYAISHQGQPARIAQGTRCGPDISAEQSSDHIARHHPARVLAEVAAKRAVFDHADHWARTLHQTPEGWTSEGATAYRMAMEWTLRLLAQPYADRPGYREEWKP